MKLSKEEIKSQTTETKRLINNLTKVAHQFDEEDIKEIDKMIAKLKEAKKTRIASH